MLSTCSIIVIAWYQICLLYRRTLPDIPIPHNTDASLRDLINWKFKYADQNFYLYYQKVV